MPKKDKESEEHPDEESELVEIIDEEDEGIIPIDENRFREFLELPRQIRSSAAVLEEVTATQKGPVFFSTDRGRSSSQSIDGLEDEDPFKYANQGKENGEEPKYVSMSSTGNPVERVDFQKVGREQEFLTRNVNLKYSAEAKGENSTWGKLMETERADPLKAGTHEDLEKRKKKEYWIK